MCAAVVRRGARVGRNLTVIGEGAQGPMIYPAALPDAHRLILAGLVDGRFSPTREADMARR
jgi:hypothetical protein